MLTRKFYILAILIILLFQIVGLFDYYYFNLVFDNDKLVNGYCTVNILNNRTDSCVAYKTENEYWIVYFCVWSEQKNIQKYGENYYIKIDTLDNCSTSIKNHMKTKDDGISYDEAADNIAKYKGGKSYRCLHYTKKCVADWY